tara:strand:+ start:110 stop:991 length:882 start_codon:yes stop_codon:yes gene_type:complete
MLRYFKKKNFNKLVKAVAVLPALPFGKKLEKSVGYVIDEKATVYDDYVDRIYNATHIGGPNHRLFDGSHSPLAMWEKIKETLPDDSRTEEIKNYVISMVKDMQTIKGIPLVNIDNKETYDKVVNSLSLNFGIKKSWFSDMLTINLAEFFVSTLGVLAFIYSWNEREKKEFADLSSTLITSAAFTANPFLFVASLISLGCSYTKAKTKKLKRENIRGMIKGFAGMGSFFMAFSVFSTPLFGLIFGICVATTVRKSLNLIPEKEIKKWIKNKYKKNEKIIKGAAIGVGVAWLTGV